MTRFIPPGKWKSGPKRKSVSQRIRERKSRKQKPTTRNAVLLKEHLGAIAKIEKQLQKSKRVRVPTDEIRT